MAGYGPLPPFFVLCAGLVAVGFLALLWKRAGCAVTMAHEGGHGMIMWLLGPGVKDMELQTAAGGGSTMPKQELSRGVGVLSSLCGYLGPSLFGLGGAALLADGRAYAVLWLSVLFLFVELLLMRNGFGTVAVTIAGGLLFLVARYPPVEVRVFLAYVWVWILLLGAVRGVVRLHSVRKDLAGKEGGDQSTDVYHLQQRTGVPAPLWTLAFALATPAAVVLGGRVMLG